MIAPGLGRAAEIIALIIDGQCFILLSFVLMRYLANIL